MTPNREREIDKRVVLSGSYHEVGDYNELSVECGKQALSIAKEVANRKRKADACAVLAWPNRENNSPFPSSRILEIWCRN